MKNIINFYAALFSPLPLLVLLSKLDLISSVQFSVMLLLYALLYNPICRYLRLIAINKVDKSSFWKFFIPFWDMQYFKELFISNK